MPQHHKEFQVGWMLFKQSGKLAYIGESTIKVPLKEECIMIWHNEFIEQIIENQRDVRPECFIRNDFTLVTFDLTKYDKDPNYCYCYTQLYQPHIIHHMYSAAKLLKKEKA